jgi:site-specific DNA-methyltransferase (adenine-specific)
MEVMSTLDSDSVDMIFADPPFNLKKLYPSSIDDNLKTERYLAWCEAWLSECTRLLKHGGALFVWNLPRWNAELASFLNGRLTFVHWIAVDIKYSLPIQRRLYPSHYSLLYYVKGPQARVFHPDRLPMQVCPHCAGDLRDYGGYKAKMNPKGVNLADVWWDISPVRHAKYKRRNGANELPLRRHRRRRLVAVPADPAGVRAEARTAAPSSCWSTDPRARPSATWKSTWTRSSGACCPTPSPARPSAC